MSASDKGDKPAKKLKQATFARSQSMGFFPLIPKPPVLPTKKRGRPKGSTKKSKKSKLKDPPAASSAEGSAAAVAAAAAAVVASKSVAAEPEQKKRGSYVNWSDPKNAATLKVFVDHYLENEGKKGEDRPPVEFLPNTPIPSLSTIRRYAKQEKEYLATKDDEAYQPLPPLDYNNPDAVRLLINRDVDVKRGRKSLTTHEQQLFIADTVRIRDETNNGMSRADVMQLLVALTGCNEKQAENHYHYLQSKSLLPHLKSKVQTVQKTTTKRACIIMEQQLRWHLLIESVWEDHHRFNQPSVKWMELRAYFMCNLDETNLQGNDGNVRIVGSAFKSKHEKIMDDFRDSITIIRIGCAAGKSGPWIFLAKGEAITSEPMKDLVKSFGAPPGSKVVMTPNAYLNDDTWEMIAPDVAAGIRMMPVIRDYPQWKVCLSLDGYGSHLLPHPLRVFAASNIEVVKEEADSSQTNQAYDQFVAKMDKQAMKKGLDRARGQDGPPLNQWGVIASCCWALKKHVPESAWIESFKRVNLHPDHRLPFSSWCEKIQAALKAGDRFYTSRSSLFDVMPSFWKNLKTEQRRQLIDLVSSFYVEAETDGSSPWKQENLLTLAKYASLNEVHKIRAAYLTYQIDNSVVDDQEDTSIEAPPREQDNIIDNYSGFTWRSKNLFEYLEEAITRPEPTDGGSKFPQPTTRAPAELEQQTLNHITNHVAKTHDHESDLPLLPSAYLDCAVTKEQERLLKPRPYDVLIGSIMKETKGREAKRLIPKRRVDLLHGNVASYCRSLNNEASLETLDDYNSLAANLVLVEADREKQKEERAAKKKDEEQEKARKKAASLEKTQQRKEELMAGMKDDINKGFEHIRKLTNGRLRELLRYYYDDTPSGLSSMAKPRLLEQLAQYFDDNSNSQLATPQQQESEEKGAED